MGKTIQKTGFTIVELLIVIVVIAILAAITIVAFNGISNRAVTVNLQSTLDPYEKALKMYHIDNGSYPDFGAVCIGESADYPETSAFPAGACVANATTQAAVNSVSSGFNDALSAYISNTSSPITTTTATYSGLVYRGAYVNTYSNYYEFELALPNSVSCPSDYNQYILSGIHWCEHHSSEG